MRRRMPATIATPELTAAEVKAEIETMAREAVQAELLNFEGLFNMDFSAEFLESLPNSRLKHILLAARLYRSRRD